MKKEVSNGALLGIVLIALAIVLGLFFGLIKIMGHHFSLLTLYLFLISFLFFIIGFRIKYLNCKYTIWDNINNEHHNILIDCTKDIYNNLITVSIPLKVSFFKGIRCRISNIRKIESIDFNRYIIKEIKGIVRTDGNFYIIGENKLARGLILLNDGEEVDLKVKSYLNLESVLGIYRIYDVLN